MQRHIFRVALLFSLAFGTAAADDTDDTEAAEDTETPGWGEDPSEDDEPDPSEGVEQYPAAPIEVATETEQAPAATAEAADRGTPLSEAVLPDGIAWDGAQLTLSDGATAQARDEHSAQVSDADAQSIGVVTCLCKEAEGTRVRCRIVITNVAPDMSIVECQGGCRHKGKQVGCVPYLAP